MIKNVQGRTLELLGEAIVSGRYPPGSSVPSESTLCSEYGVSRTVVREVIKGLVAKGLVSTGPKVGTRVLAAEQWTRKPHAPGARRGAPKPAARQRIKPACAASWGSIAVTVRALTNAS